MPVRFELNLPIFPDSLIQSTVKTMANLENVLISRHKHNIAPAYHAIGKIK